VKMDANRVLLAGHWLAPFVEVYDLAKNLWSHKAEWTYPQNIVKPLLVNVNNRILSLGGRTNGAELLNQVLELDEGHPGWMPRSPMAGYGLSQSITLFSKSYSKPSCNNN